MTTTSTESIQKIQQQSSPGHPGKDSDNDDSDNDNDDRKNKKSGKKPKINKPEKTNDLPKKPRKYTTNNHAVNVNDPAYISVIKAMIAAAYRMIGLRRTYMHHYQAAALFDVDLNDLVNPDYQPQGIDEVNNLEWARKFNNRPCLVMAWQRHGACYFVG